MTIADFGFIKDILAQLKYLDLKQIPLHNGGSQTDETVDKFIVCVTELITHNDNLSIDIFKAKEKLRLLTKKIKNKEQECTKN
jgi:hypothetical protein